MHVVLETDLSFCWDRSAGNLLDGGETKGDVPMTGGSVSPWMEGDANQDMEVMNFGGHSLATGFGCC